MSFVKGAELLDEDAANEVSDSMAEIDMAHVVTSKLIYDHVTNAFPLVVGKAASKKEREENGKKETTLVYGEINFETFGVIMERIKKIYGRQDVGASGPYGALVV